MEKYKLKKETLLYKPGTICVLTQKGNLVLEDNKGTCVLSKHSLERHPNLLDEWFEKIEEKKYGGRVPKRFDRYWYIDAEGYIQSAVWGNIDIHLTGADEKRFECGGAFWTEEEAEKELARRKTYVILKEDTKGFEPDWNDGGEPKYFVGYRWEVEGFIVDNNWRYQWQSGLYFATEEDAEASIEAHEKEWKIWFGVKDEK